MKTTLVLVKFIVLFNYVSKLNCQINNVIDLTWNFDNDTIYWKNIQPFKYTKKVAEVRHDGTWYAMNEFCAGEHGGTHFDAPYHFYKSGWKVGEISLSRLMVPGVTVDVPQPNINEGDRPENLQIGHLQTWISKNGAFPDNSLLLVRFNWAQFYPDKILYLRIDEKGKYSFPGVSPEAAQWIVNSKKFVGIGVDTASIDPGVSTSFTAHRLLSEEQMYILENVNIVPELPAQGYYLIVFPMKIKEGTGAPVRVAAVPGPSFVARFLSSCGTHIPIFGHLLFIVCVGIIFYFNVVQLST